MKALKKILAVLFVLAVLAPATVLAAETNSGAKVDISTATATASNLTYNGTKQTSNVVVKVDGKNLVAGKDYTVTGNVNTKAGTYTVTITGMGNYTGTKTTTYKINAKSASGVKTSVKNLTYNGKVQTAKVVIKDGSRVLVEGTDYTIKYLTHKNAGYYTAKVKFIGNYAGTKDVKYAIHKLDQKVTVKGTTSVKASTVKKASKKYSLKVSVKANAKVSYKSNNKNITIDKNGKITVKKGTKKGTKATITITTKATTNYRAATKKITFTVK
ncbi:MAG: hypothetical protein ACI4EF_00095 [Coprococcus sp.]